MSIISFFRVIVVRLISEIKIGIARAFVCDFGYCFAMGTIYRMLALVEGIYELNELILLFCLN